MCGRFVASRPLVDIVETFHVDDVDVPEELVEPRWNVAPQAAVLAVTDRPPKARPSDEPQSTYDDPDGQVRRRLSLYKWGLVPSWAKDPSIGAKTFNARAEGIESKAAFRAAVAKRRCLIPADAFYEWKRVERVERVERASGGRGGGRGWREPWCFRPPGGGLFAFAGLWEAWRPRGDEDAEWLLSCTIITTDANSTVAPVHDRMPVVLEPEMWDRWLAPGRLEPEELHEMLAPPRDDLLEAFRVSPEVNSARSEGPQLWVPEGDKGRGGAAGAADGAAGAGKSGDRQGSSAEQTLFDT